MAKAARPRGKIAYIADLAKLVERKKVVPRDVNGSKLYKKLTSEDDPMPPLTDDNNKPVTQRPSKADIALVRQWIEAGAPTDVAVVARAFISDADILAAIDKDLDAADERARPFLRYFTITHLYNAGLNDDELQTYRGGLSKLVNSLSWGRQVVPPAPLDAEKTIFRIDLRDYKWNEQTWRRVLSNYPYGVTFQSATARNVYARTKCELPYVRADWFVFAASRPPLYHEVLDLPDTDRKLEDLLKVDVAEDIRTERIARAGFNGSGVSRNNRLIERHDSPYGALWVSDDFKKPGANKRKNLFAHPLGPGDDARFFEQDGGEIIFNLLNGLQAYMLVDAKGGRIDKGPTEIVSDPKQEDRAVINGVSCMSCHARGMIEKSDQVRETVLNNPAGYEAGTADLVKALYPSKEKLNKLLKDDADRFLAAVEKSGAAQTKSEPVVSLSLRFQEDVDAPLAAAEAGLTPQKFREIVSKSPTLASQLGALNIPGGTVQRDVFVAAFGNIIKEVQLGKFLEPLGSVEAAQALFNLARGGDSAALVKLISIAEAGSPRAMTNVGILYAMGNGGLKNDDMEAVVWFKKAASAGEDNGMLWLGFMYENGRGGLGKDEAEAASWYRKAADAGNVSGMVYLGQGYEKGTGGLAKDDAEALRWYRKAADAGNAEGMWALGNMYGEGRGGLGKDEAEAARWYGKWAEISGGKAMDLLGFLYERGRGGLAKDDVEAVKWFRKAAEAGDAHGMNDLADMYMDGRGGLTKDETEAVKWYRKSAEAGDTNAMWRLGRMYKKGLGGLTKDEAEAFKWFRKAADVGDSYGMFQVGLAYEYGGGVARDKAEAVNWYRKAAGLGNSTSMYSLGELYEAGEGGLAVNHQEARSWMQKAAKSGNPDAKEWLDKHP